MGFMAIELILMAIKTNKAIKISQKHLLGIQDLSVSDVSKNIDKNVDVDVCLWDERLSTVGAFNLSSQLDVNVSKREKNIDQNAAAFILQGAIDYLNN